MQPLLLLHGAIGAKDQLVPLQQALADQFETHAINFSGHGGTPLPAAYTISQFANDVLQWMEQKAINRINIFGYSMGGYVAMYLAKHHPEKVGKIFTVATKYAWSEAIAAKEVKLLNPEKIEEKVPTFAQALKQRHAPEDWKVVMAKTADMMLALGKNSSLQQADYASIEHTVQVAVGDKDTMVSLEETAAVYQALPNASLLVMPHTPHPIEQMNVERLAHEIKQYF